MKDGDKAIPRQIGKVRTSDVEWIEEMNGNFHVLERIVTSDGSGYIVPLPSQENSLDDIMHIVMRVFFFEEDAFLERKS